MRKWIVGVGSVVVLAGVAYLGGQAYSSYRFNQQIEQVVAQINSSPLWQAKLVDVDKGWFHSSGQLEVTDLSLGINSSPMQYLSDYDTRHGILHTHVDGNFKLQGSGWELLFGQAPEVLSHPVAWQGSFTTLSQALALHIDVPNIRHTLSVDQSAMSAAIEEDSEQPENSSLTQANVEFLVESEPAKIDITHENNQLKITLDLPKLVVSDDAVVNEFNDIQFSSKWQQDSGEGWQQLTIPAAKISQTDIPDIELKELKVNSHSQAKNNQLSTESTLSLADSRMADQQIFSGKVSFKFSQINLKAYLAFIQAYGENMAHAEQIQPEKALEKVLPPLRDLLAGSPELSVSEFALKSDFLALDTSGDAHFSYDGAGMSDWEPRQLLSEQRLEQVLNRLSGKIKLNGEPPGWLYFFDYPKREGPLQIELQRGVIRINGAPISSIY